eukprot:2287404-Pyramimonas_sp.AAC.1
MRIRSPLVSGSGWPPWRAPSRPRVMPGPGGHACRGEASEWQPVPTTPLARGRRFPWISTTAHFIHPTGKARAPD